MLPKNTLFAQYYTVNRYIEYENLIEAYPWILERGLDAIISPDSDGFLCGLLMSNFLGWRICGFYDGKVLLLKRGIKAKDCIFLDMDIYRADIRSIGHHMVMFNKLHLPSNWYNFNQCLQINNIRNYDFYNNFALKYPLATIHLLIGILGTQQQIDIPKSTLCPLLFTDGTWMNLFQYTENSLSWIKFLRAEDDSRPLNKVFCNEHYSVYEMMIAMDDFLRKRDKICAPREKGARERGDRLIISTAEGLYNLDKIGEVYSVKDDAKNRAEQFLKLLSDLTKWDYKAEDWTWGDLKISIFAKDIFSKTGRLSTRNL